MKKRTPYSEAYLKQLPFGSPEATAIFQEIHALASNGESISIAEESFRGSLLSILHGEDGGFIDVYQWLGCENFLFNSNYLQYLNNFDGRYPEKGPFGEIPKDKVAKDIKFLEEAYQHWLNLLNDPKKQEVILQGLAKEAKENIKKSDEYGKQLGEGSRLRAVRNKSVTLHSKYLFLKVKEFFQEYGKNEVAVELCGKNIIIDAKAHYHILFRHFAKQATPYQFDADYHKNEDYHPEILPIKLASLIDEYDKTVPCDKFNDKIYVEISNVLYSIRFAPKKGSQNTLRLLTFFPVEKPEVKQQVATSTKYISTTGLIFYA